jgi:hypothetical protein
VRRERTNTPLQALLLMNETQMIEASRALAERVLREGTDACASDRDRLTRMFKRVAGRTPDARELAELESALHDFRDHYRDRHDDARKLVEAGETRPGPGLPTAELAAWTMIGNIVLNLDEVVTKG